MKQQPFVIERVLNAPSKKVWEALTIKEKMKQWYFDIEDFKPEKGAKFQFKGGKDDRIYTHLCEIKEVIPEKKLAYSWRYEGYSGNSLVTIELFPEGNKTKIRLTHEGLETFGDHPDFAPSNFAAGWTHIIGTSLPEYLSKQ